MLLVSVDEAPMLEYSFRPRSPRTRARTWVAGYELLALGHALTRERHLLGDYREAWNLRANARRRRQLIQARRARSAPLGLRAPE